MVVVLRVMEAVHRQPVVAQQMLVHLYVLYISQGARFVLCFCIARLPFARLPTTSVAWNLSSSSVVHSSSPAVSPNSPELLPFLTFLRLLPPFLASARSKLASGFTIPCVTASSFLCSCPTSSFFRLCSAATCASGVVGLESSLSAEGIVERPMVSTASEQVIGKRGTQINTCRAVLHEEV